MSELTSSPDDGDTSAAYASVARDDELSTARKPRGHDAPPKGKSRTRKQVVGPGRRGVKTSHKTANPLLGLARLTLRSATKRKLRQREGKTFR